MNNPTWAPLERGEADLIREVAAGLGNDKEYTRCLLRIIAGKIDYLMKREQSFTRENVDLLRISAPELGPNGDALYGLANRIEEALRPLVPTSDA